MKLLINECMPQDFRLLVIGHDAFTVGFMCWSGVKNGELIRLAGAGGFEALITTDRQMEHQVNRASLPIALITLLAPSNDIDT